MILADLPSEILAQIIGYKHISYCILQLWKCGNTLLNTKLSSGVTYVHLEADHFLPRRYPLMLSELRNLRYLYVFSAYDDPIILSKSVRKLPPTIEALHLITSNSLCAFRNYTTDKLDCYPNHIKSDYGRGETSYYDTSTFFPRLHTLELRASEHRPLSYKDVADFAGLPSSLTRLITNDICLHRERQDIMQYLPRSLIRLEANIQLKALNEFDTRPFLDDWANAPPQLEHVDFISFECDISSASWIPPTLTSGDIVELNRSIFTPEFAASLPPTLGQLYIRSLPFAQFELQHKNWALELPKHLHTLTLNLTTPSDAETAEHRHLWHQIACLPRSITNLSFIGFENVMSWHTIPSNNISLNWPPALTSFDSSGDYFYAQHFKLLPTTLTSFKAYIGEGDPIIDGSTLPRNLTLLSLRGKWILAPLSITNHLPTSLTDLTIESERSCKQGVTRETFERLQLLTSLKRLVLDFRSPQENNPEAVPVSLPLPPNLEELDMPVLEISWIASLPRSLTVLRVDEFRGTQRSIDLGFKHFLDLPPRLVSLLPSQFGNGEIPIPVFPEGFFPHLPALRELEIPTIGKFPSSILRALPTGLKILSIDLFFNRRSRRPIHPPKPLSLRRRLQPHPQTLSSFYCGLLAC